MYWAVLFASFSGALAFLPHPSHIVWLNWPSGMPCRPPGFLFFVSRSQCRWYHTEGREGVSENRPGECSLSTTESVGCCLVGGWSTEGLWEGSWEPLFNFAWSFQIREKTEWCPLSPCHTGTFKKQPQWFLKRGVSSRDRKEEKNKWLKNVIVALCKDWL